MVLRSVGRNANRVYELDGLKRGPILLGEAAGPEWLTVAGPAIQACLQRYRRLLFGRVARWHGGPSCTFGLPSPSDP
jgi:hypothetical protein